MRVVALKAWSNGSISMEERQVKELPDALAAQLVAQGIVAPTALPEITDADAGKVLTATNSGVWVASELPTNRNADTLIQIAAEYTNGSYVCNNTFDTDSLMNQFGNGADLRLTLTVDGSDYQLYPALIGFVGNSGILAYETYDPQSRVKLGVYFNVSQEITTVSISENDNRFIVTLTPTAADYSGTMDKTVEQINAAYEAGREIVARVITGQDTYADIHVSNIVKNTEVYPSYTFYLITIGKMIVAYTGYTDDGTKSTYSTLVYTLTPAT